MTKKERYKILDRFLSILKDKTEESPIPKMKFLLDNFSDLSNRDRAIALHKLKKDGMIDSKPLPPPLGIEGEEYLFITFDGVILSESEGGYKGRMKKEKISGDLQLATTWAIAVGTAVAGLYALVEIFLLFFHHNYQ